ncbi:DUF3047 domain-containing protein [Oryzomonas japonica]|uniref:DUF3047 domain-containing protein n=1 Tax=Oryzomonas japonica TaxID=2603858 RepID=UPI001C3FF57C|nr:DUF3047 domain-containing protein [Oryzomonas japonica]
MQPYRTLYIAVIFVFLTVFPALAAEPELRIGKFSSAELAGWKEQTVFGSKKSAYTFVQDNGKSVLMGKSHDSASGLLHKIDIDPKAYPIIKWSWKIDHTIKKGNERTKDGHDFAARLYVVFPRGFFSKTRAIEYVWGNVLRKGESIRNPYSKNVVMIAMDGGDELAGRWTSHRRNFAEDYRAAFGEEAPKVGAIAIMTDSDNTHESATGYYGDITVLPAPREEEQKPKEPKHKEQPAKEQPAKPKEPLPKEQTNGNGSHPAPPAVLPPAQNQQ